MTGYEQILVIILGSFLALFLLLSIIVLVLVIKVLITVRRITTKAEALADKAEAVGDFFKHAAGPMAVARTLASVAEMVFRKKSKANSKRR